MTTTGAARILLGQEARLVLKTFLLPSLKVYGSLLYSHMIHLMLLYPYASLHYKHNFNLTHRPMCHAYFSAITNLV